MAEVFDGRHEAPCSVRPKSKMLHFYSLNKAGIADWLAVDGDVSPDSF